MNLKCSEKHELCKLFFKNTRKQLPFFEMRKKNKEKKKHSKGHFVLPGIRKCIEREIRKDRRLR